MRPLAQLAWFSLWYNLLVILWGAWVRIRGAGAGCGDHWPLCNGVVVPQDFNTERLIEYSHRLSTGFGGLLAIALLALALTKTPKGHPLRVGAAWSLGLMLLEGLVGGIQVLLQLTADSTDPARGFFQAIHLINTFLLIGAILLTALWASGRPMFTVRNQGKVWRVILVGLILSVLMGMAGAVTALGDLLFKPAPGTPLDTIRADMNTVEVLRQMRFVHPLLAIVTSAFLVWMTHMLYQWRPTEGVKRWGYTTVGLIGVQMLAGFANVALRAPDWMQILHLLLACGMWLSVILVSYEALTALRLRPAGEAT